MAKHHHRKQYPRSSCPPGPLRKRRREMKGLHLSHIMCRSPATLPLLMPREVAPPVNDQQQNGQQQNDQQQNGQQQNDQQHHHNMPLNQHPQQQMEWPAQQQPLSPIPGIEEEDHFMENSQQEDQPQQKPEPEDEKCGICLEDSMQDPGCLDGCKHRFCFECIARWAKESNQCPLCKQRFHTIHRLSNPTHCIKVQERNFQADPPQTEPLMINGMPTGAPQTLLQHHRQSRFSTFQMLYPTQGHWQRAFEHAAQDINHLAENVGPRLAPPPAAVHPIRSRRMRSMHPPGAALFQAPSLPLYPSYAPPPLFNPPMLPIPRAAPASSIAPPPTVVQLPLIQPPLQCLPAPPFNSASFLNRVPTPMAPPAPRSVAQPAQQVRFSIGQPQQYRSSTNSSTGRPQMFMPRCMAPPLMPTLLPHPQPNSTMRHNSKSVHQTTITRTIRIERGIPTSSSTHVSFSVQPMMQPATLQQPPQH